LDETRAVLNEEEAQVAALRYEINEIGEMHHNPSKNVLYVRASIEEIAARMKLSPERVEEILSSARTKMLAARLKRPTPYVDKTLYVAWNSLCVSAYLEAAKVLGLEGARRFALKSLDRILAQAWRTVPVHQNLAGGGARSTPTLMHVVAYSDPEAEHREIPGVLDDYASTAIACLDAYEATAEMSYFRFAQSIAGAMMERFYDSTSGGFFDSEPAVDGKNFGVLRTRRKPLQDAPTPAGNPLAAVALMRLHGYTGDSDYREKAEQTLETFAGVAEQFGIFAATYAIATLYYLESPLEVVVVAKALEDKTAGDLYSSAVAPFRFNKALLRLTANQAVAQNLPPVLAATIPNLPELDQLKASFAVLCSGNACQPPIGDASALGKKLEDALAEAEQ
jgi:uncharacterized protein